MPVLLSQAAKYAELVNSGCVYAAKSATCAAVVAVPTTASVMGVQNNNADGSGVNMVILAVGAIQIASPASMTAMQIIVSPMLIKPATTYTGSITPVNLKPRSGAYAGLAILDDTATVVDGGWFPIGPSATNPLASTPGMGTWVQTDGLLVIPPGGAYAFHCMASTTAVTIQLALIWAEINM